MQNSDSEVNLVLVADRPERAGVLRDQMREAGVKGLIRRLPLGGQALACGRRSGSYRWKSAPDLVIFDYSHADEYATDVLRQLAFGENKAEMPVVLMTSPETEEQLDAGDIDGGKAVMFSPTGLGSFMGKLREDNRARFLKALRTLYQYGPILVRTPNWVLQQDEDDVAISA